MKSQINELRELLKKLSPSPYSNCLAGNSTIKYYRFGMYQIWTGGTKPYFEGTFDEVKETIEQQISAEEYDNSYSVEENF